MARTNTKRYAENNTLSPKLNSLGIGKNAESHPPKNSETHRADISNIFAYSPKKNKAKVTEEYSVLYPETSSASASGKSNGALLVSASIETKNTTNRGSMGSAYQEEM